MPILRACRSSRTLRPGCGSHAHPRSMPRRSHGRSSVFDSPRTLIGASDAELAERRHRPDRTRAPCAGRRTASAAELSGSSTRLITWCPAPRRIIRGCCARARTAPRPLCRGMPRCAQGSAARRRRQPQPHRRRHRQCLRVLSRLAERGLVISSGLAAGHRHGRSSRCARGAGLTLAVLGTGVDRIYPESNRALSETILHGGALMSAFPLGTPPRPANFPRRNRVLAALSLGTLVVEAARGSGSLITARAAQRLGQARVRDPRFDSQSPEPGMPSTHQRGGRSGGKRG